MPLPPNRTGGSPASGSPVGGRSVERERLFASSPSSPVRRSVSTKPMALGGLHHWLALAGTRVGFFSVFRTCALPPSCVPSLHGHYPLQRYYGRSDSRQPDARTVCPTHPPALAGLPDYYAGTSSHSVSNHRRDDRGSPGCQRIYARPDRLRHSLESSPIHADRIEFTATTRLGSLCYGLVVLVPLLSTPPPATQLRFDTARLFTAQKPTSTAPSQRLLRRTSAVCLKPQRVGGQGRT